MSADPPCSCLVKSAHRSSSPLLAMNLALSINFILPFMWLLLTLFCCHQRHLFSCFYILSNYSPLWCGDSGSFLKAGDSPPHPAMTLCWNVLQERVSGQNFTCPSFPVSWAPVLHTPEGTNLYLRNMLQLLMKPKLTPMPLFTGHFAVCFPSVYSDSLAVKLCVLTRTSHSLSGGPATYT